jgi:hypothetical protein
MICILQAGMGFQQMLTLQIFHIPAALSQRVSFAENPSDYAPYMKLLTTWQNIRYTVYKIGRLQKL